MNVIANARASEAVRRAQHVPVLKATELFSPVELASTRLYAGSSTKAQLVVDYLAPFAKSRTLDEELSAILRRARATVNRTAHLKKLS